MDQAAAEEKRRKAAATEASRKRSPSTTPVQDVPDSKRPKLEQDDAVSVAPAAAFAGFDFTTLPAALVTDLVIANLQAFSEASLTGLIQAYRHKRSINPSSVSTPSTSAAAVPGPAATTTLEDLPRTDAPRRKSPTPPLAPLTIKEEPVDPLKMDIDEEEIEYEPDKLNLEVEETLNHLQAAIDIWSQPTVVGRAGTCPRP